MPSESKNNAESTRLIIAAIAVLIVLETLMLGALYTKTVPHPPLAVAPFAIGPFTAASIAVGMAAIILDTIHTRTGMAATALVLITALVTFGPQKWIDPAISGIWPAILLAQLAIVAIVWEGGAAFRMQASQKRESST